MRGRARSGCGASSSWKPTGPASGRAGNTAATTCAATRGSSMRAATGNDTGTIPNGNPPPAAVVAVGFVDYADSTGEPAADDACPDDGSAPVGAVAEWSIVQHWKCCVRETVPRVRIPPAPLN